MTDQDAKERLNNNEFCELIPHLPFSDLLRIEYRKDRWYKLVNVIDPVKKLYGCSLCCITNSNAKNMNSHIEGKKHKENLNQVKQFFHPEYTYMKHEVKLAASNGPTASAHNKTHINQNSAKKATAPQQVTAKPTAKPADSVKTATISNSSSSNINIATQRNCSTVKTVNNAAAKKVQVTNTVPKVVSSLSTNKNISTTPPANEKQLAAKTLLTTINTGNVIKSPVATKPNVNKTTTAKNVKTKNIAKEAVPATIKTEPIEIVEEDGEKSTTSVGSSKSVAVVGQPVVGKIFVKSVPKINMAVNSLGLVKPASSNVTPEANKSSQQKPVKPTEVHTIHIPETENSDKPNDKSKSVNTADKSSISTNVANCQSVGKNKTGTKITQKTVINLISNKQGPNNNFDSNKNSDELITTMVKNPFAREQQNATENNTEVNKISNLESATDLPDVIVIDDDQHDEQEIDSIIREINSAQPKPQRLNIRKTVATQKATTNTATAEKHKSQVSENDNEPQSKKQKLLLNPAAAFLDSNKIPTENTNKNSEKPQYQTDRVIIPTIHKQPSISKANVTKQKNTPKFSTKTFSSKPSDDEICGLIGVEYVVKIMKSREDIAPKYECSLCELILDGPNMQNHLVAYNHRLKFCEKHFPTAMRQYRQYLVNIPSHETFKVLTPILAKLAIAIEQHHGRDLPYECLETDFNGNRHEMLSKVFSCRHASEQYGPAFTHILDAKEIDLFIAQKDTFKPKTVSQPQIFNVRPGGIISSRHLRNIPIQTNRDRERRRPRDNIRPIALESDRYQLPGITQFRRTDAPRYKNSFVPTGMDDEIHKQMVADFLLNTQNNDQTRSPSNRQYGERMRRSRSRERTRQRSRSNSRQTREGRKSISPLREGDIWQAYRHRVDQKIHDLNAAFKVYRKDPEKHPMYNDEWQKFWKRRKDELIEAGLDHRSYNYQPEWVDFFQVRVEELYLQAQENVKIQSRERLFLPMSNENLMDSKYHVNAHSSNSRTSTMVVDTEENVTEEGAIQESGNPEVVPVLRLLTALEDHLGSLGPRIINLMSNALFVEKNNPSEMINTVLTIDNCTLLETAMEKLKGILFAGLLEGAKARAFKKVIAGTKSLLVFTEEMRKRNPIKQTQILKRSIGVKQTPKSILPSPVPPPVLPINKPAQIARPAHSLPTTTSDGDYSTIGSLLAHMDKKQLAAKLAATLTAQGKTDFNPDQLEQLIAVYTVIEKKKREASVAAALAAETVSESSNNQKTLSDTLVDFMNPSNPNAAVNNPKPLSTTTPPEDECAKKSYTAATINRYLEVMRRTGGVFPNSEFGNNASEIWKNLQNIQRNMETTNVGQNRNYPTTQVRNGRNATGSAVNSTFKVNNSFDVNNHSYNRTANNAEFNMSNNEPRSYGNNFPGAQSNYFGGGVGNSNNGSLAYQQQNLFLENSQRQQYVQANTSGNMYTNTSNHNRVTGNNIDINLRAVPQHQQQGQNNPGFVDNFGNNNNRNNSRNVGEGRNMGVVNWRRN